MAGVSRSFAWWFSVPLWQRILGALLLGAALGYGIGPDIAGIRWIGDLFIRMIRMLIAPLVFVTLVSGVVSMPSPGRIASIGLVIGFVLPFDRLLDMWRTTVNVTGDLAVATAVAASEGELDPPVRLD